MAKTKILLFCGGEIHNWKEVGDAVEPILRADDRFEVTRINEDLSVLESPKLDSYDAIVFYYTVGTITETQRNGLLNYIASGKGYVGIHSAADSFRDCEEYRAMVGGYFVTHPRYRQYQVMICDPEHVSVKAVADKLIAEGSVPEFYTTDEMYVTSWDSRVKVLAKSLWGKCTGPVAWVKEWGKGRVYWLALGHDGAACNQPIFAPMLINAILWAANPESKV